MTQNKKAVFAGGCFWCVEHDLREVPGVVDAISGYAGGEGSPSYERHQGYKEAVEVEYDPAQTSFKKLTQFFLDHIDPTDSGGQFHDRGAAYQTAILYKDDEERAVAESLLRELAESKIYDEPIAVQVLSEDKFYPAEDYHQRYAQKNPSHYDAYRRGSGRAEFVSRTCMVRDQMKVVWKD